MHDELQWIRNVKSKYLLERWEQGQCIEGNLSLHQHNKRGRGAKILQIRGSSSLLVMKVNDDWTLIIEDRITTSMWPFKNYLAISKNNWQIALSNQHLNIHWKLHISDIIKLSIICLHGGDGFLSWSSARPPRRSRRPGPRNVWRGRGAKANGKKWERTKIKQRMGKRFFFFLTNSAFFSF